MRRVKKNEIYLLTVCEHTFSSTLQSIVSIYNMFHNHCPSVCRQGSLFCSGLCRRKDHHRMTRCWDSKENWLVSECLICRQTVEQMSKWDEIDNSTREMSASLFATWSQSSDASNSRYHKHTQNSCSVCNFARSKWSVPVPVPLHQLQFQTNRILYNHYKIT